MNFVAEIFVRSCAFIFNLVKVPESFGRLLSKDPVPVFVLQISSWIHQGLLLSLARRSGFACIKDLGSDAVFPAHCAKEKALHFISLNNEAGITGAVEKDPNCEFATLSIFPLKGPVKIAPAFMPDLSSRLGLIFLRRILNVVPGTPMHAPSGSAKRLFRALKVDFFKSLKLVRGAPFHPIQKQERIVLSGQDIERDLKILAERSGEPFSRVRKKASAAFYELAANPQAFMYNLMAVPCRILVRRLFSQILTRGIEKITPALKNGTVVLVPMHRSHLDYLIIGSQLFDSAVMPPLVAAGINLSFWPMGSIFRSLGAYFVKRNARERLHAVVLKRYVAYLTQCGHSQEFFIEGGRSRSGLMLEPKAGLLSIFVDAFLRGQKRDLLFVPVAVSYEHVVEDEDYAAENRGGSKTTESFLSLIRAFDVFKRRYGEVVLSFGEPVSLEKLSNAAGVSATREGKRKARADQRDLTARLGAVLTDEIRNQVSPTLNSLACTAILMSPGYGMRRQDLVAGIKKLVEFLNLQRKIIPSLGEFSPALGRFLNGQEDELDKLCQHGIMKTRRCLDSDVFYISWKKRFTADYYRNLSIHFFAELGIISLVHVTTGEIRMADVTRIGSMLRTTFLFPDDDNFRTRIEKTLSNLKESGLVDGTGDLWRFTETGRKFCMPSLLLGNLQTLLWVHYNLRFNTAARVYGDNPETLPVYQYDLFLKALGEDINAADYLSICSRTEAASRGGITSAIESLSSRQIVSVVEKSGEPKKLVVKTDSSDEFALLKHAINAAVAFEVQNMRDAY